MSRACLCLDTWFLYDYNRLLKVPEGCLDKIKNLGIREVVIFDCQLSKFRSQQHLERKAERLLNILEEKRNIPLSQIRKVIDDEDKKFLDFAVKEFLRKDALKVKDPAYRLLSKISKSKTRLISKLKTKFHNFLIQQLAERIRDVTSKSVFVSVENCGKENLSDLIDVPASCMELCKSSDREDLILASCILKLSYSRQVVVLPIIGKEECFACVIRELSRHYRIQIL